MDPPTIQSLLARSLSRRSALRAGVIGATGLTVAAIAGCGGDEASNPTAAGSSADETPRAGGVVNISGSREPTIWDPVLSEASPPATYAAPLYPHLFVVKITPETNGNEFEFETDLVESWEQPDERTYVFKLRNGKWGPHSALNGRAITAEDVAFSLQRWRSSESVISANYGPMESVQAVDARTVKVTLSHGFSPFIAYLSDTSAAVAPPEVTSTLSDLETARLVHGGPWVLDNYTPGVKVAYKRNTDYYLTPLPYVDLTVNIFPNSSAAAIAFESKQIQTLGVSPRELKRLTDKYPQLKQGSSGGAHQSLFFNTTRAPWSDPRVRLGIQKAIDFGAYRRILFPDAESLLETPARAWLAPYALPQKELEELYKPDIAESKRLLSAAGFPNGFDGGTLFAYPGDASEVEIVSPVVQQLKAVGVNFKIDQVEFSDYQKRMKAGDYNVGSFIYSRRYPEVDQYLWPRLHSRGPLNYSRGNDATMDRLLDQQRADGDPAKRIQTLHELQRYFIEKLQWMIVLPTAAGNSVWWPDLRDYNEHVSFGQYQLRKAWLAQ
jgi:peptide/nickel transport system substrate-binding protein